MKLDEERKGGEKVEPREVVLSRTLTGEKGECCHDRRRPQAGPGVKVIGARSDYALKLLGRSQDRGRGKNRKYHQWIYTLVTKICSCLCSPISAYLVRNPDFNVLSWKTILSKLPCR